MSWGGTLAWLIAFALCAAVLWAISFARNFLRAFAAMWRPVALVVISGWLLFLNDQGRELGLSLMGENSLVPITLLFFALVYWAANNWHSARLGLYKAVKRGTIPEPEGDEIWLYWPPRLLGVCAHLFAAINLSLSAWSQPEFADGGWRLFILALAAPIAVICATACVWAVDYRFISSRTSRDGTWFARIVHKTWFKPILLIAIAIIALMLAVVLGYAWWWKKRVSTGFALGTLSITLSAIVFLLVVSRLRRGMPLGAAASEKEREKDRATESRRFTAMTCWLFLIAGGISVCTFLFPMQVGNLFGSMVVAYLAFGAILATVNIVELAVIKATEWRRFGTPRKLAGYVVAFLLVLALVNAMLRPFHAVRLCADRKCTATSSPANRLTVQQAAHVWYDQARKAYEKAHPDSDDSIPMLIVAAAGGGIRAAYWTATVLERLDFDLRAVGGVSPYLFAISGVSGGSVGATAFVAALAAREKEGCKADPSDTDSCPEATNYLKRDFLAPALASWIFVDGPSNLLPNFGQIDRGTAIERSFEEASKNWLARPFLSFFRKNAEPSWRPILLLNATHEETGQRAITAHVKVERDVFLNGLDALHLLGGDVRASTAAHNSARFFYLSPAGNLGNDNGSVIDGGYFENYGALSALELSRAAKDTLDKRTLASKERGIKRIILLISSDPDLDPNRARVRIRGATATKECVPSVAEREPPDADATGTSADGDLANFQSVLRTTGFGGFLDGATRNGYLNELFAPVIGIQSVREAHGARAAAELATDICAEWLPGDASAEETVRTSGAASVLDRAKQAAVSSDPGPAPVLPNHSYFAHMAMCKTHKPGESPPVIAPLGWVLSQATRDAFKELLHHCDNDKERKNLESALGKPR